MNRNYKLFFPPYIPKYFLIYEVLDKKILHNIALCNENTQVAKNTTVKKDQTNLNERVYSLLRIQKKLSRTKNC